MRPRKERLRGEGQEAGVEVFGASDLEVQQWRPRGFEQEPVPPELHLIPWTEGGGKEDDPVRAHEEIGGVARLWWCRARLGHGGRE